METTKLIAHQKQFYQRQQLTLCLFHSLRLPFIVSLVKPYVYSSVHQHVKVNQSLRVVVRVLQKMYHE